mmetsp:Transcript_22519/g.89433  ORF Transcript_22519/g.89433 Transcript_22519/m.89433 type:complete len:243 (-) Transcript_22519:853-1581(-)
MDFSTSRTRRSRYPLYILAVRKRSLASFPRASREQSDEPRGLALPREQCAVDGRRVGAVCGLAGEEEPVRDGLGHSDVVFPRRADWQVRVGGAAVGVAGPVRDDRGVGAGQTPAVDRLQRLHGLADHGLGWQPLQNERGVARVERDEHGVARDGVHIEEREPRPLSSSTGRGGRRGVTIIIIKSADAGGVAVPEHLGKAERGLVEVGQPEPRDGAGLLDGQRRLELDGAVAQDAERQRDDGT